MKKIIIYLQSGEMFETTRDEVNFETWGVDAIVMHGAIKCRMYIPYTNVKFLEQPLA